MTRRLIGLVGALLLAAIPAAANAEWREAETAHFRIYGDRGEGQLVRFAQRLEALDSLLRKATGTPANVEPTKVRVILLGTIEDVQRAYHGHDHNIAGFYTVNIEGPIAVAPLTEGSDVNVSADVTLFHEYAHHFQLEYLPATYPAWFVEGFAEIAASSTFETGGKFAYGKASYRGYSLTSSRWVPVQQLLESTYASFPEDGDFYGKSWLLAHYLTFSEKRAGQLRKYLAGLAAGMPNLASARAAFGNLDDLNREVHIYLDQASFPYRMVPIDIPSRESIKVTVLSPGAGDLMQETAGLSEGMSKEEMAAYLAGLRAKVERTPADPYALQLLADADYVADDYAGSRSAADRLLAVAPASVGGRVRKAMILLHDAESLDGAARQAKVAEARRLIVAANRAATEDPQPLVAYYRSFLTAGEDPPPDAVAGLIKAVEILPADEGPRMMLVNQLVRDSKLASAISYLAPIAYDPHRGKGKNEALEMIESLKVRLAAAHAGKPSS